MDQFTPDQLEAITKLALAQEAANRLKQSELNIKRREETVQLEQIATTEHLKQEVRILIGRVEELLLPIESAQGYAHSLKLLAKETRKILNYYRDSALKDDAVQDFFLSISHELETLQRGVMLSLMSRLESPQVRDEAENIIDDIGDILTVKSKKRQLIDWQKSLNRLEEKRARGDDDLRTLNQIEEAKEAIEKLRIELDA